MKAVVVIAVTVNHKWVSVLWGISIGTRCITTGHSVCDAVT